ncbi:hypothetical protein OHAE_2909 [Ochrobactrum soli]|uniref:Uncharacterized protein n=1 Tax=Ochrobactrum soli TaxID=2448455 RepID=A0A2P9HFV5_9HYPH|nr:hypothetical protein OHAE_2909 [[Ochrobactrum] soli]
MEPLYLFVFTHYPTQNRYALLLEMLYVGEDQSGLVENVTAEA